MSATAILDHLSVLGEVTRSRILLALERHELTVAELCAVLQAPQSTVSRHLKALLDCGWVTARAEGTSRLYRTGRDAMEPPARRLWQLVREQVAEAPASVLDGRRLERVLAERRTKSQEFFTSSAGQWDRVREELFGRNFHFQALLGLLDDDAVVGDLGCGGGQVAEALAPCVRRVIAVDDSAAMLQAARRRLRAHPNVELRRGRLEALPIDDGALDAATCVLVLHHVPNPADALAEAARVLRPGGRLLVVDMQPHEREHYRQQMGHVWLGFAELQITAYLAAAGFEAARLRALPPEPRTQGPALFAVSARHAASTNGSHPRSARSRLRAKGDGA
ncbi:MAG: metalloregulator ArsR/SmtB family transcription factor [Deltaproteobacteria bacterium]|nr:metalloregulator ArsR/SmtB family transcription factor [Deltaproteobacteria bacterium]